MAKIYSTLTLKGKMGTWLYVYIIAVYCFVILTIDVAHIPNINNRRDNGVTLDRHYKLY